MLDNFTITAFEMGWQVKMLNIRYQMVKLVLFQSLTGNSIWNII